MFLVVNDKDRFIAREPFLPGCLLYPHRLFFRRREIDIEGRPMASFTVDTDISVVAFHDPVDHREPQPRAPSHFLGGEEGLENPALRLLIHPLSAVRDGYLHVVSRFHEGFCLFLVADHRPGSFDIEIAPSGHRLPGVDEEIHEDLFHLRPVRLDEHKLFG